MFEKKDHEIIVTHDGKDLEFMSGTLYKIFNYQDPNFVAARWRDGTFVLVKLKYIDNYTLELTSQDPSYNGQNEEDIKNIKINTHITDEICFEFETYDEDTNLYLNEISNITGTIKIGPAQSGPAVPVPEDEAQSGPAEEVIDLTVTGGWSKVHDLTINKKYIASYDS